MENLDSVINYVKNRDDYDVQLKCLDAFAEAVKAAGLKQAEKKKKKS